MTTDYGETVKGKLGDKLEFAKGPEGEGSFNVKAAYESIGTMKTTLSVHFPTAGFVATKLAEVPPIFVTTPGRAGVLSSIVAPVGVRSVTLKLLSGQVTSAFSSVVPLGRVDNTAPTTTTVTTPTTLCHKNAI